MQDGQELIHYVIKHTDQKFEEMSHKINSMDVKLDELINFKWQIVGGSVLLSIVFNIVVVFLVK